MKKLTMLLSLIILIIGCDDTTSPEKEASFNAEILANGTVISSYHFTEANKDELYPVLIADEELGAFTVRATQHVCEPDNPTLTFGLYARRDGYYSSIISGYSGDTLRIDYLQDFIPTDPTCTCGTIFDTDVLQLPDTQYSLWQDGQLADTLAVNTLGQFQTTLPGGEYQLKIMLGNQSYDTDITLQDGYADYFIDLYVQCYKPNIYLYPTQPTTLDVTLGFPLSGRVDTSIPAYPHQWKNLHVQPDGSINHTYRYLYYESSQPDGFQRTHGWVIKRPELTEFFSRNMQRCGFNAQEIADFLEHWIPRLNDAPYYAIYPQFNKEIDPLIQLTLSQQPDSLLRLFYVITPASGGMQLPQPHIPAFERKGFAVTEWGVVL